MTREALHVLVHKKLRPEWLLLALLLLPLTLLVDGISLLVFRIRLRRALQTEEVICECGCHILLVGFWKCGSCGLTYWGHAWQPCPHDGELTHSISCSCG